MSLSRDMKVFDEHGKEIPWERPIAVDSLTFFDLGNIVPVRPTYVAVRMSRGWRVYGVDVGITRSPLRLRYMSELYESATPGLRFPTIDAARMYLKLLGGQLD